MFKNSCFSPFSTSGRNSILSGWETEEIQYWDERFKEKFPPLQEIKFPTSNQATITVVTELSQSPTKLMGKFLNTT
jgi:hypothetical protein